MELELLMSVLLGIALMGIGWITKTLSKIKNKVDDLYSWHNVNDDSGLKIWYSRKSLETVITALSENISKQTEILNEFLREIKETRRDVVELKSEIQTIRNKLSA